MNYLEQTPTADYIPGFPESPRSTTFQLPVPGVSAVANVIVVPAVVREPKVKKVGASKDAADRRMKAAMIGAASRIISHVIGAAATVLFAMALHR